MHVSYLVAMDGCLSCEGGVVFEGWVKGRHAVGSSRNSTWSIIQIGLRPCPRKVSTTLSGPSSFLCVIFCSGRCSLIQEFLNIQRIEHTRCLIDNSPYIMTIRIFHLIFSIFHPEEIRCSRVKVPSLPTSVLPSIGLNGWDSLETKHFFSKNHLPLSRRISSVDAVGGRSIS